MESLETETNSLEHEEQLKSEIEDELLSETKIKNKELALALKKVKEQVPSVFKLLSLIGSKIPKKRINKIKAKTAITESKNATKKKFKVIHLIFLLGFGFLLFEEELIGTPEEPANEKVSDVKEAKKTADPKIDTDAIENPEAITKKTDGPKVIDNSVDDPLMIGTKEPVATKVPETIPEVEPAPIDPSEDITTLFKNEVDTGSSVENAGSTTNAQEAIESINEQANATTDEPVLVEQAPETSESVTSAQVDDSVSDEPNSSTITDESDTSDQASDSRDTDETDEADDVEDGDVQVTDSAQELGSSNENSATVDKAQIDQERIDNAQKLVDAKVEDDITDDFLIKNFDEKEEMSKPAIKDLQQKVTEQKKQELISNESSYDLLDSVNYEIPGRGLVYNCQGGHWACLSIKSYSTCQNDYSYDLENKKLIKCYPSAIYESDTDCEEDQLIKVSNSAKTDFCN